MNRPTLLAVILVFLISACAAEPVYHNPPDSSGQDSLVTGTADQVGNNDTALKLESVASAHFTAVGDLLVERPILYDAQQNDGTFQFDPLLTDVEHLIKKGQFAYANQETPITGAEFGLGDGNFVFNNPYELGHYYYQTGFNMLQLANNHTLDMEFEGLKRNIAFWRDHYPDVVLSGAHLSSNDREVIPIIVRNGISIAFISSTYSSNLPVEFSHLVNIFSENEDELLRDVTRANEMADLVAVGIHWGKEYEQPVKEQEQLAQKLVQNGADIILGHHPHVLQPLEWIEGPDGQRALVAYSLGNFISGPFDDRVPELDCDRLTGSMIGFDLIKVDEEVTLDSVYAIPTFTAFDEDYTNYRVSPLDEIEQEDFRWCDLETHKKHVTEILSRRMDDIDVRMK
ncbi:CapA family protein [Jeotgalibacillus proteolyticus]|uniref:CapA family protein n=1 Tax=Jeotgalibacillus proteolyticus TaxID=2082395 RepID=UPI001431B793|nr:CapA family protein [Jeotgalibacillus proteolyticus]